MKYGRWTLIRVERRVGKIRAREYGIVRCMCGARKAVRMDQLKARLSSSCGCYQREVASKHGLSRTAMYHLWASMKTRCYSKEERYKNHGGRGIRVSKRWFHSFEEFYKDMGDRPEGMTLDRIDNNKGYSKKNCRWATNKEQMQNRRVTRLITYEGRTQCAAEWAREAGMNSGTFQSRMTRDGWTMDQLMGRQPPRVGPGRGARSHLKKHKSSRG